MKTIIYFSKNDDGTRCGYYFEHKGKKYSDIDYAQNATPMVYEMVRRVMGIHGGRPIYEIREILWDEFLKKR